jgi:hypothetical protein
MKAKLMLVAISLIGSAAFAQESANPKFVVLNQGNPAAFKAIYDNPGATRSRLSIYKGMEKVYGETLNIDGFVRTFNFAAMSPGEYTMEIIDNTGSYTQKVKFSRTGKPSSIHVAKIATGSKYLLSVANEEAGEINVRILDGKNNIVHNQSLAVNGSVGLVYDLASVQGNPTFEVSDNNGAFRTIKY